MIALLLLACTGGPAAEPLPVLGGVPPFELTDATGSPFSRTALDGKIWIADFMFTSCTTVCPILSTHMSEVQAHYSKDPDVRLVSFSVDPGTDTPPVLAAYGARYGADPARWIFLTGPMDTVKSVVVDSFKMMLERIESATEPATILHGERFVVVDRLGRIRAYPDPKEPGKTELYAAVDALLAE